MTLPSSVDNPIVLTMGDPAGVGPQITWRAWQALRQDTRLAFAVIAPVEVMERNRPIESADIPVSSLDHIETAPAVFRDALPVLPIDGHVVPPGEPAGSTSSVIVRSIDLAVELTASGSAAAVVTNPISKALLYESGFSHPGHTEFLGELSQRHFDVSATPIMMLVGGGLRVALATIHIPLSDVASSISMEGLLTTARTVDRALKQDFGITEPRIAFAGLNPHAGESGALGREEIETINPAASRLRSEGISISDARPGDTVFSEAVSGEYDAVIAMYHDQGLAPLKTLDMWGGVNVTLGLPFIRTSPDHGTGYPAAKAGTARADSLIAAIRTARSMADNRSGTVDA